MAPGVLTEKHSQQQLHVQSLLQPPTWAVPAKGETRLEVGHLTLCLLTLLLDAVAHLCTLSRFSLFVNH